MSTVLKTFVIYPSDRCGGVDNLSTWATVVAVSVQGSPIRPPEEKSVKDLMALAEDVDKLITLYRDDIERLRPNYLIQYAVIRKELAEKPKSEHDCERRQFSFWATLKTLELNFEC